MEEDERKYLYQLILGQLLHDGYDQTVQALTSELKWPKDKKPIRHSDELKQLVAISHARKSQGKRKKQELTSVKPQLIPDVKTELVEAAEPQGDSESSVLPGENDSLTCKICPRKFSRDAAYQRHLKVHKAQEANNKSSRGTVSASSSDECDTSTKEQKLESEVEETRPEYCEETAADQSVETSLGKKDVSPTEEPQDSGEDAESSVTKKKTGKHADKVCRICDIKFKLIKNLQLHMKDKHSEMEFSPYKCRKCDEGFDDAFKRYRHEANDHEGLHPKPVKPVCDYCGVTMKASSLADHIRAFHTGVKPHKCKYCDRRFVKTSHLVRHERVHTGEKPYACGQCDKKFADKGALDGHQAREHSAGDENIHKCSVCFKVYRAARDLTRHEKSHVAQEDRPHACQTCGKKFTTLSILKEHTRIHAGVKPFVCQICGKSFTQNAHLQYHIKIHTEDKPYKCETCGAGFRCAAARRKHQMSHAHKRASRQRTKTENEDPPPPKKRKTDTKKTASKSSKKEENSAGLQAARGLVAMAAGQGTTDKSAQRIVVITPPGVNSEQKQLLLTSGGQLVQQVVVQQAVDPTLQPGIVTAGNTVIAQGISQGTPVQKKAAEVKLKIAPQNTRLDRTSQDIPENYQLIYIQAPQDSHAPTDNIVYDQSHVVPRVVAQSSNQQPTSESSLITNQEVQVTSMGEQVVTQQLSDGQEQYHVVLETDHHGNVYQASDILSLSMAASNVGQGGESEQLTEEHTVDNEAAVSTSVQWT